MMPTRPIINLWRDTQEWDTHTKTVVIITIIWCIVIAIHRPRIIVRIVPGTTAQNAPGCVTETPIAEATGQV